MSTKTTFKRIALVAVASLGFGMLSVVAANAVDLATTHTAVVTSTPAADAGATPGSAGTPIVLNLKLDAGNAGSDDGDVIAIAWTLTDPAGQDVTSSVTWTVDSDIVTDSTVTRSGSTYTVTVDADGSDWTSNPVYGTASFTPSMGGVYTWTTTTTSTLAANTNTEVEADVDVFVAGAGATVSASGLGSSTIGAVTGGIAKVKFAMAAHANPTTYNLTSAGVGSIQTVVDAADTVCDVTNAGIAAASDWSRGATVTCAATTFAAALATVASSEAGVQTLTWTAINATTGAPSTVATATITWGAAPSVSTTYSTSYIAQGAAAGTSGTNALGASLVKTAGGQAANITVTLKDAANTAINGKGLCAVVTGPGTLGITPTNTTYNEASEGRTVCLSSAEAAANDNIANISVWADGTAGTATVTITSGTTTVATESVIFYGAVATLEATQNLSIARAGSAGYTLGTAVADPAGTSVATTPAVTIVAKDSVGNVVPGLTITAVSSDTTVISSATIIESDGNGLGDGYAGPGYYNASVTSAPAGVSGKAATVTFRVVNPAAPTTYITTAAVPFTLGGSAYLGSVSAAFDAADYTPGSVAKLTISVKDSAGNPTFDQDLNLWGGVGSAPIFSKSVNGSVPTAAAAMFLGGKKTYTLYAPSLDGEFSVKGTLDALTVASGAVVTASATVTGNNAASQAAADAAAEATDAANAATDAANAAAEAADAATAAAQDAADAVAALSTSVTEMVNALKKQITSLTNLVIKIQKKVKA